MDNKPPTVRVEPTVKLHPDFKAGETVTDLSTGEPVKISEVTAEGNLRIPGRAGLMPPSGVEKILPDKS